MGDAAGGGDAAARCIPGNAGAPSRRGVLLAAAALALQGRCPALAGPAGGAAANPGHLPSHLQGLRLLDQHGRAYGAERLRGHPTLLNFVYTQCSTVCPVQTRALVELRAQLPAPQRARLQLLSVSLDALSDTPATMLQYARRMGADQPGWHWVSGRPDDITRLADALVLFPPRPQPGQAAADARRSAFRQQTQPARGALLEDHTTALWLLDEHGDLRQRYAGNPVDIPRLAREVVALDELARTAIATR